MKHGYHDKGRWYASNDYRASEHGGTHLDAPSTSLRAFAPWPIYPCAADRPGPGHRHRQPCVADPDYLLSPDDIRAHEARHGPIEPGAVVLVLTGFGAFYPDARRYLGSDVRVIATGLHFPGIGEAAARLLVERRIDLVGLDTASLDHGPSTDFAAHRVFSESNTPGIENVANLDKLPPVGATVLGASHEDRRRHRGRPAGSSRSSPELRARGARRGPIPIPSSPGEPRGRSDRSPERRRGLPPRGTERCARRSHDQGQ